ncbi:MAG: flagellar hook basal-body protein [Planctomycetaceae bacterium]|nr:flagellar hook basal-body protein [Planctomycetaceae bacterium]
MVVRSANIAGSGLATNAVAQAIHAHNVANILTPGFEAGRVEMTEMAGRSGVAVGAATKQPHTGSLILTGNPLDLAIGGSGFFMVEGANGVELTRDGRFQVDAKGNLTDAAGRLVRPAISVPADTVRIGVSRHGDVVAVQNGGQRTFLGTLQLATVGNPRGLVALSDTTFGMSAAAGPLLRSLPGVAGFGYIVQGGFESSNVDMIQETVSRVVSARAFDANASVFRIASAMSAELNEIGSPARRDKKRTEQIDLSRTQASRLVRIFGDDIHEDVTTPQAEELSPEVRARLTARRLNAPEIAEIYRVRVRYVPERFSESAGGPVSSKRRSTMTDRIVMEQELRIAQRQAAEAHKT